MSRTAVQEPQDDDGMGSDFFHLLDCFSKLTWCCPELSSL